MKHQELENRIEATEVKKKTCLKTIFYNPFGKTSEIHFKHFL